MGRIEKINYIATIINDHFENEEPIPSTMYSEYNSLQLEHYEETGEMILAFFEEHKRTV